MGRIKIQIGMELFVPKFNKYKEIVGGRKGTVISVQNGYAILKMENGGYNESFYFNQLRYIKRRNDVYEK